MTDPDAAPHGGESLTALLARVAAWLDEQAALDGTAVAVTHGGVVKAAVVHALVGAAERVLASRRLPARRSPSCTPTTAAGRSRG